MSGKIFTIAEKKAKILCLAASGEEKPLQYKHPLGLALKAYTGPTSCSYDANFAEKLREMRPDWFKTCLDPEGKKKEIIELAQSGADKPQEPDHPLGSSLRNYLCPSSATYDPKFKQTLKKLRPDWFRNRFKSETKKKEILELAKSGANKSEKLVKNLSYYLSPSSSLYDPEFRETLKKLCPDWFRNRFKSESKKKEILELAQSGADKPQKPDSPLEWSLRKYFSPSSSVYDPEFKQKLKKLRPDWFRDSSNSESKKKEILELARSGADRPKPKEHPLGYSLRNYLYSCCGSYDAEFKDKLQELRPDWFYKTEKKRGA